MKLPTSPRMREGDHTRGVSLENGTAQPDGEWLSRSPHPDAPCTDTKPANLSQPWLQRPRSRGPGDRLLSCSRQAVEPRTQLSCVRSERRANATTNNRSDQGSKNHAEGAQVRRRAHRGMRALGADSRRRQHRCETHRSRRQAHRAPQQPLTTPIEQRLATLLAQMNNTDPKLCFQPKYSAKKAFP